MPAEFLDIAMTPDVMDVQHEMGSDELWQSPHRQRRGERFGASEEAMIATRDSFYLATLSQTGWPYICLLYTSPSPRDPKTSRMPSSA